MVWCVVFLQFQLAHNVKRMKWLSSNVSYYDYNDIHQLNQDVFKKRNLVEKYYAFEVLQLKLLLGLLEVDINVIKLYHYLFLWEIGSSKISHPFLIEYPYFTFSPMVGTPWSFKNSRINKNHSIQRKITYWISKGSYLQTLGYSIRFWLFSQTMRSPLWRFIIASNWVNFNFSTIVKFQI